MFAGAGPDKLADFVTRSQPKSASGSYPGLPIRRRTQADLWNGLLWKPKDSSSPRVSFEISVTHEEENEYFDALSNSDCSCGHTSPDTSTLSSVPSVPTVPSPPTRTAPASTRLRYLIKHSEKIIVAPGVYDGLSARIALSVGFDAMYMTGAGTTASRLGMADLAIAQLHDMRENAEMIAGLEPHGAPLIADMDTGYGGPIMVANSVQQYIKAGVAGFHIEDQIQQKRCGHLAGKEVVDTETWLQRLRAAIGARDRLESDAVIIARTDAMQSKGYEDCIARLRAARDVGADVGILEGFQTREQARQAVIDLAPWPLLLNSVENGVSPLFTVQEAQDMGFRIMIFSFASLAPAYTAIKNTFEWLKAEGVTGSDVTPKTIFKVCGLDDSIQIDQDAGGQVFAKGV